MKIKDIKARNLVLEQNFDGFANATNIVDYNYEDLCSYVINNTTNYYWLNIESVWGYIGFKWIEYEVYGKFSPSNIIFNIIPRIPDPQRLKSFYNLFVNIKNNIEFLDSGWEHINTVHTFSLSYEYKCIFHSKHIFNRYSGINDSMIDYRFDLKQAILGIDTTFNINNNRYSTLSCYITDNNISNFPIDATKLEKPINNTSSSNSIKFDMIEYTANELNTLQLINNISNNPYLNSIEINNFQCKKLIVNLYTYTYYDDSIKLGIYKIRLTPNTDKDLVIDFNNIDNTYKTNIELWSIFNNNSYWGNDVIFNSIKYNNIEKINDGQLDNLYFLLSQNGWFEINDLLYSKLNLTPNSYYHKYNIENVFLHFTKSTYVQNNFCYDLSILTNNFKIIIDDMDESMYKSINNFKILNISPFASYRYSNINKESSGFGVCDLEDNNYYITIPNLTEIYNCSESKTDDKIQILVKANQKNILCVPITNDTFLYELNGNNVPIVIADSNLDVLVQLNINYYFTDNSITTNPLDVVFYELEVYSDDNIKKKKRLDFQGLNRNLSSKGQYSQPLIVVNNLNTIRFAGSSSGQHIYLPKAGVDIKLYKVNLTIDKTSILTEEDFNRLINGFLLDNNSESSKTKIITLYTKYYNYLSEEKRNEIIADGYTIIEQL